MKKALIILVVILLIPILIFASCVIMFFLPYKYCGDRSDLYTVAVNNVFGLKGYLSNGEVNYDPAIEIIETDDYGRILFFYSEYYDDSMEPSIDYGMAFVIMQRSEDNFVYYYQDVCYMPYFDVVDDYDVIREQLDPARIDELKALND